MRFAGEDVMIYLPDGGQCSDVEECRFVVDSSEVLFMNLVVPHSLSQGRNRFFYFNIQITSMIFQGPSFWFIVHLYSYYLEFCLLISKNCYCHILKAFSVLFVCPSVYLFPWLSACIFVCFLTCQVSVAPSLSLFLEARIRFTWEAAKSGSASLTLETFS